MDRHPVTLRTRRLLLRQKSGHDWLFEHDGAIVGAGHLRPSTTLPGLEIGCYVAGQHRGRGLAAEAVAAILAHGHRTAPAIFVVIHDDNHPARKLAARVGFIDIGGNVFIALRPAGVHHVELWVADLARARTSFGWLFTELGWTEYQRWDHGVSWRLGASYVVVEDSPARTGDRHERTLPGMNHLALHAASSADVDRISTAAPAHGWRLMFADRHPYAGGPDHYAAYLENEDGFEVEVAAAHGE